MKFARYNLLLLLLCLFVFLIGCERKDASEPDTATSESYVVYFETYPGSGLVENTLSESFPPFLKDQNTYIESSDAIEKTKTVTIQNKTYEVEYEQTIESAICADKRYEYKNEQIFATFRSNGTLKTYFSYEAQSAPFSSTDAKSEYQLLLEAKEIISQVSGKSVEEYAVQRVIGEGDRIPNLTYTFKKIVNEVPTADSVSVRLRPDGILIEYSENSAFGMVSNATDLQFDSELVTQAIKTHITNAFAESQKAYGDMIIVREPNSSICFLTDGTPYLYVKVRVRFENKETASVYTGLCIFKEEISSDYFQDKSVYASNGS